MTSKRNTWVLVVITTAAAFLLFSRLRDSSNESNKVLFSTKEVVQSKQANVLIQPNLEKYDGLLDAANFTKLEDATKPVDVSEASWRATVFFHQQNFRDQNGPVTFYGKIVDQNNEPVVGADISGYSDYYVGSLREQLDYGGGKKGRRKIEVKTNIDGLFVVDGYKATNLNFTEIKKVGYHAKEKLPTGLIFGNVFTKRHKSDISSPVLFPMWKMGKTVPLIKKQWRTSVIPDGRAYILDIESGQIVEAGTLRVNISADYDTIPDLNRYPWKLEVSSPAGEIIESNDAFLYKAPESGYLESLTWEIEDGKKWSRDLKRSIYIKLKNGAYAGVTIDAKVYQTNEARIVVSVLINPSGSTNLEYDVQKEIKSRK